MLKTNLFERVLWFNYYCKGVCFIDITEGIRVKSPTKTVRQNRTTYKRLIGVHCIAGISQITRRTTSTTNCTKGVENLEWFQPIITRKHPKNTVSKKTVFQTEEEEEEEKDSISNSFETAIKIYTLNGRHPKAIKSQECFSLSFLRKRQNLSTPLLS